MKNVTDFRKTVEADVDPHLQCRIKAPSFNVSKERTHLFLSAAGRGECNGPCHARNTIKFLSRIVSGHEELKTL